MMKGAVTSHKLLSFAIEGEGIRARTTLETVRRTGEDGGNEHEQAG